MSRAGAGAEPGLVGVGYEGRTLDDLLVHLVSSGVSRLVDVRLNAISRKPGLSKTAFGRALAGVGIVYEHRRELGNPKANRAGFGGSEGELQAARSFYRALLSSEQAGAAMDAVVGAVRRERVAVLCFEADQRRCHRDVLMSEVRRRFSGVVAGRSPAR